MTSTANGIDNTSFKSRSWILEGAMNMLLLMDTDDIYPARKIPNDAHLIIIKRQSKRFTYDIEARIASKLISGTKGPSMISIRHILPRRSWFIAQSCNLLNWRIITYRFLSFRNSLTFFYRFPLISIYQELQKCQKRKVAIHLFYRRLQLSMVHGGYKGEFAVWLNGNPERPDWGSLPSLIS